MATRTRMARRAGRPGIERLEGRALLNASIDIAADGSLLYRTDSAAAESLRVSVAGGVYTFAVDPANNPIDVTNNAAGLTVTGSGTRTVTVAGPARLRIEMAAGGQSARVESTAVATAVVFQGDDESLVLGGGPQGVRALGGAITVTAAAGSELNSLRVDDGSAAYGSGLTPSYVVAAGTITANGPVGFAGVTYSGVSELTVKGTSDASAPSPLYLVRGTAAGAVTTIDATAGPAHRNFSILGTSTNAASRLRLLSAGTANVWVASINSPTSYDGGRAEIWLESVRSAGYGINSDFVIADADGPVDVAVGNFWNLGPRRGAPDWFLGFDVESTSPFAALRDATNSAVGGLFYRPGQVHSLSVNAQGNAGASLMVDFRNGDPLPFGPAAGEADDPRAGLTYVGAAGIHPGSPYALAFVGAPPSGAFSSQSHTAMPLYRGLIELVEAGGGVRNVAYQLDAAAPLFDDASTVTDYRWFYDIMAGAVDGRRTLPNGTEVSAEVDSSLGVGSGGESVSGGLALSLIEANPNAYLAKYLVSGKTRVRLLRGWSLGETTTFVNYVGPVDEEGVELPVDGLASLTVDDASPADTPNADVVRLQALPPGIAAYVLQNFGDDSAIVSLTGIAGSTLVAFDGGEGDDTLYIDADGLPLNPSTFIDMGGGVLQIPPLNAEGVQVLARSYQAMQVFNSSTQTFTIQPVSIAATARAPLTNVTAGYLTASITGFSPVGLTAAIAWGDGSTSPGTIEAVPGAPGSYRVVGSHTYALSGVYTPRVAVSATGTATTTVAGIPITFQVAGASGSAGTAPQLLGRLAASSDSGTSDSDAITNVTRPSFTGLSGLAGAFIDVYATPVGGGTMFHLGSTTADAAGLWTVLSTVPLADGAYTIQAISASTTTFANGTATLSNPLVIDTLGPRVWSLAAAPLSGTVDVVLQDFGGAADSGSGIDLARARDAASYALAQASGAPRPITSVNVVPGSTNRPQTVTLRTNGRLRPGDYLLTVFSSAGRPTGIRDIAGNALDGAFTGRLPSGGSNTGADFRARLTLNANRLQSLRPIS